MNEDSTIGPEAPRSPEKSAPLPSIRVRNLSVRYGDAPALRKVDLDIPGGGITALLGPSGSGKSTLLSVLNRLTDLVPACRVEGAVWLGAREVHGPGVELEKLRRQVGMVFQKPSPFPLSIQRNLELPLKEHGMWEAGGMERVRAGLQQVGLWEEVADRMGSPALSLSGGQQQRLCIARALVLEPEVLLLDEPTSSLDPLSGRVVEDCISNLPGCTVVVATHDVAQARRLANHAVLLWSSGEGGRVVESAPAIRFFRHPRSPLTRSYLNAGLAGGDGEFEGGVQ